MQDLKQAKEVPTIPTDYNLSSRILCKIVSNAAVKSRIINIDGSPESASTSKS